MEGPRVGFSKEINQVIIKNGECITVYFQLDSKKLIQVELRNTKKYGLEIFFDSDDVSIKDFSEWKYV